MTVHSRRVLAKATLTVPTMSPLHRQHATTSECPLPAARNFEFTTVLLTRSCGLSTPGTTRRSLQSRSTQNSSLLQVAHSYNDSTNWPNHLSVEVKRIRSTFSVQVSNSQAASMHELPISTLFGFPLQARAGINFDHRLRRLGSVAL